LLAVISAAMLFYVAHRAGNLLGGWSGGTFWDGCARVSYSFVAGMLVYRFKFIIKNKLGFIGLSILLFAAFLAPFSVKWNWLTEPLLVILDFPLMVAFGAGSVLTPGLRKVCVLSGKISYPLYMTHYAVLWMFGNYITAHKITTGQLTLTIMAALILLPAFAYLVMTFYDEPLRKYLSRKRKAGT